MKLLTTISLTTIINAFHSLFIRKLSYHEPLKARNDENVMDKIKNDMKDKAQLQEEFETIITSKFPGAISK